MKYRPQYPFKGFKTLEEARSWVNEFVKWYNTDHFHSGINFISPYQRHYGLDKQIMENRIKTYEEAKAKHPERWTKNIRDWSLPEYVALNPISEEELENIIKGKVSKPN
jgi:viroplasmin and RNaseH domain-containing protein